MTDRKNIAKKFRLDLKVVTEREISENIPFS